jgi:hypothetical protein
MSDEILGLSKYLRLNNDRVEGGSQETRRIIRYPFDRFEVKVILNDRDQFVGIEEIKINTEFLSLKQKISLSKCTRDIEEYYSDE